MRSVKVWNENISVGLLAAGFFSVGSFSAGVGVIFPAHFSPPKNLQQ
jgi:hypothetical protein